MNAVSPQLVSSDPPPPSYRDDVPIHELGLMDAPEQLLGRVTRGVSTSVRRAHQARLQGAPGIVARNAGAVGNTLSGVLNTVGRPLVHPGQAANNIGESLRVGPARAVTGIAKLLASAAARVLLGKDHHKRRLGIFGRLICGVKDAVYKAHDWAARHHDFREEPTPPAKTAQAAHKVSPTPATDATPPSAKTAQTAHKVSPTPATDATPPSAKTAQTAHKVSPQTGPAVKIPSIPTRPGRTASGANPATQSGVGVFVVLRSPGITPPRRAPGSGSSPGVSTVTQSPRVAGRLSVPSSPPVFKTSAAVTEHTRLQVRATCGERASCTKTSVCGRPVKKGITCPRF